MANRAAWQKKSAERDVYDVYARFTTNGAGAVDQDTLRGDVISVTRTGVGTFDVVFRDKWPDVRFFDAKVLGTGEAKAEFNALDVVAGTATLVTTNAAGTVADLTADVVYIKLEARNSKQQAW